MPASCSIQFSFLRLSPVAFLLLLSCCVLDCAAEAPLTISLQSPTNRVSTYQKLEFNLALSQTFTNPFDPEEVEVSLDVTAPGGTPLSVPAFWYQPYERRRLNPDGRVRDWFYPSGLPGWKARFAPSVPGTYSAVARVVSHDAIARSQPVIFQCERGSSRGFLRTNRIDPRFLEFSEGQSFFAIGQNLAFIGSQQYVTLSKAEEIFGKLAQNGANYLRIWTCCDDWAMAIEARKSAFGRSWDWHPPFVEMPGDLPGRKCLLLSGKQKTIHLDPSHPLALKPATTYVFSVKARFDGEAQLNLDFSGKNIPLASQPVLENAWREFQYKFTSGPHEFWLPPLKLLQQGQGKTYVSELSLKEAAGGPELLWEADPNKPVRGYYNPLDCFMLDELLASAERHGIYLQLCLLTRNLYMAALKDPASREYERAIHDARRTFRYAIARWGCSTALAAWEYWNEEDPGLPTDKLYTALGEYLETADPYHHLRTTSTWGPSAKDCQHPKLDVADVHFYLRPADKGRLEDEVAAVMDRTRWLREQAPAKPAHVGEFGIANDKWQPRPEVAHSPELNDLHNALWASALSGASGTAMFWWWERLDQRNFYPHYRPLSRFIADIPWTSGHIRPVEGSSSDPRVRVIGLAAKNQAWLWIFNRESSWINTVANRQPATPVSKAEVRVSDLPPGPYNIRWANTLTGETVREDNARAESSSLHFIAPAFESDLACRIIPADAR